MYIYIHIKKPYFNHTSTIVDQPARFSASHERHQEFTEGGFPGGKRETGKTCLFILINVFVYI